MAIKRPSGFITSNAEKCINYRRVKIAIKKMLLFFFFSFYTNGAPWLQYKAPVYRIITAGSIILSSGAVVEIDKVKFYQGTSGRILSVYIFG